MECECGAYYIGKTKQEFWRLIAKHMYSMQFGNRYLPVGRHAISAHGYTVLKVTFTALYRMHTPDRGGDWHMVLLQKEQKWIFQLQAMSPPGLNESI